MKKILMMVAAAMAALLLAPASASAQTGYQLDNISSSSSLPGGTITVYVNGFGPGTTVTITLESDPVVLATVAAGSDGVVNTTVTIPADTPLGSHTIVVRGVDRDGNAKVVSFPITIGTTSGGLPTTGANTGLGLAVAAIAVGIGATLLTSTRRRSAPV